MADPVPDAQRAQARDEMREHIETCVRFYCDERFEDERRARDAALAYFAALTTERDTLREALEQIGIVVDEMEKSATYRCVYAGTLARAALKEPR